MTPRTILLGLFATTIGCANTADSTPGTSTGLVNSSTSDTTLGSAVNDEEAPSSSDEDVDLTNDEAPTEGGDPVGDTDPDFDGSEGTEDTTPDEPEALVYPDISEDDVPRMTQELMQDVIDDGCEIAGMVLGEWNEDSELVEGKILSPGWNTTANFSARLVDDGTTTTWAGGWTELLDGDMPEDTEPSTGLMEGTYDATNAGFDGALWEGGFPTAEIIGYWVRQTETTGFMFGVGAICD
jgi:hypothetical protein